MHCEAAMFSNQDKYGENYKSHLLEQYKLYVEMADKISERRQSANSFFLSVNTVIVGLTTYFTLCGISCSSIILFSPISMAGLVICYMWYRLVRSYRDLNTAKFKVIHEIEQQLPLAPYDLEWCTPTHCQDRKLCFLR
jgi:plasmid replication initiation protein